VLFVEDDPEGLVGQRKVGHQFRQSMLQRMLAHQLGQPDLGAAKQGPEHATAQRSGIHIDLVEQRGQVGFLVGRLDRAAVDGRLGDRRIQRAFHRKHEVGRRGIQLGSDRDAFFAQAQRMRFDLVQDVDHPAVFRPHLIIEKAAELLGQLAHRGLGPLGGVQPVVVDVPQARIRSLISVS
jgi:hypothetical protein